MMTSKIPRMTERLDAVNDVDAAVAHAAHLLRQGGLVAVPTETVYGLAASALDSRAVERVFEAKGRPSDNPLIVHVADIDDVSTIALPDALSMKILRAFAPGPLTVVLPRIPGLPQVVTAGLETVAVRVPDHQVMQQLLRIVGPLAAPSANRSGRPSPTTADHVLDDLDGRIDAVLDAGACSQGIESTVIRVDGGAVTLLRPGALDASLIEQLVGAPLRRAADAEGGSPGMRHRHYAPSAPVLLCHSPAELIKAMRRADRPFVLARPGVVLDVDHRPLTAHELYAELRLADALGADKILVLCDASVVEHEALWNRLRKAADAVSEAQGDGT
ncbi:MAG: threonylcarbamoyl-AMP synthase [Candidatus Kapabacteria bacterium]|nr:threonylcarbamoyl-AMP synthase [Candidatus Kapabacteria bacterium]